MVQFPFEGFFEAASNPSINNQIWNAVESLYKGWNYKKSQSCLEVGFEFGRIYQALINFEIPDQILYAEVRA